MMLKCKIRFGRKKKINAFSIKLNMDVLKTVLIVQWKGGSTFRNGGSKFCFYFG